MMKNNPVQTKLIDEIYFFFPVLYNLQVRFCDRNDIYTYCGK